MLPPISTQSIVFSFLISYTWIELHHARAKGLEVLDMMIKAEQIVDEVWKASTLISVIMTTWSIKLNLEL
jgi:hypothetical protein